MTSATNRRSMTLEEYLNYEDGTDTRYELVNGKLVEVPSESDLNNVIALYLLAALLEFVPVQRMRRGTEIVISGPRATTLFIDSRTNLKCRHSAIKLKSCLKGKS